MPRSNVGLVIRSKTVEVAEAVRTFRGIRLGRRARVPIEGADDAQVMSAITSALAAANIRSTVVGVTVPEQEVVLRAFTLPHLPRSEWATAVQFEARKYVPFRLEDLVWDFHAVEDRVNKQLSVVFVAIRADLFARVESWLEGAGIQATCIEAPWLSLARLAGRPRQAGDDQCLAIVDIEPDAAHILIVKDQLPFLARDVNLAVVSEGPGIRGPRAEKLLTEIRLSFDFFTREHPSASISRLLLFGEGETVSAWLTTLGSQLPCPVEAGALPAGSARGESVDLGFGLAASVAQRDLRPPLASLDFINRNLPQEGTGVRNRGSDSSALLSRFNLDFVRDMAKPAVTQAVTACLALGLLIVLGNQHVVKTRQQVNTAIRSFQDVGWGLAKQSREELETLRPKIEKRLAFLERSTGQRVAVADKLIALQTALQDGVWLEGLHYSSKLDAGGTSQSTVVLQGACFLQSGGELGAISRFAQRIKQDKVFLRGFSGSQLGEITQVEDGMKRYTYRTFQLSCQSQQKAF